MVGKIVLQETHDVKRGYNTIESSVNNLSTGVYYLKLIRPDGETKAAHGAVHEENKCGPVRSRRPGDSIFRAFFEEGRGVERGTRCEERGQERVKTERDEGRGRGRLMRKKYEGRGIENQRETGTL